MLKERMNITIDQDVYKDKKYLGGEPSISEMVSLILRALIYVIRHPGTTAKAEEDMRAHIDSDMRRRWVRHYMKEKIGWLFHDEE